MFRLRITVSVIITIILIILLIHGTSEAVRVKDIADVQGVRKNQLIGYGLVIGLDGTGDSKSTQFTIQTLVGLLGRMGITVDPNLVKVNNVAAVMVTANLPPFAKVGSKIDVIVSSIGDTESLQGGTLLLTPLKAPNGKVYAVAQGPVSIGGFSAKGAAASVQQNHPTVAQIPGGAVIEKEVSTSFFDKKLLSINLHNPDFTTATRLVNAINSTIEEKIAVAIDPATVEVKVPERYKGKIVEYLASLENLEITPDSRAKIVLDERTGTIVVGANVRISTVAISHGNLTIQIKEVPEVSQPTPLSTGTTTVVPRTELSTTEQEASLLIMPSATSIGELAKGLNAVGVTPRDFIAIIQAIKAAGALQAELEII
ncbi:MAG TPA: flagellar basal body P-ring protein FlgI [Nitrospinota bacterium]|nr:flagellar basal body P-ring protein FlgI [Nitrospinota bacterium]